MEDLMLKKSIFKQGKKKVVYKKKYESDGEPYLDYDYEIIDEQYTYECDLSMPLLNQGDKFYIEEDNKTVQVSEAIRTSKDNVFYNCYPEYLEANKNDEEYLNLKTEVDKEKDEFKQKQQEKVFIITEPATSEITGFRKFIKNLFNL